VHLPWWGERLRDDALFAVSNVQSLPEEARNEKEWFLRGEIHSFVIIPVTGIDGNTHGFLRLDVVGRTRTWPDADLKLLGMLGEMFSIHMERVEREAELLRVNRELQQRLRDRTSEATEKRQYYDELRLMRSVVVNTHDSVIVTNAEPVSENSPQIIYVNAGFTKTMGYAASDAIGRSPRFLCGEDSDPQTLARIDHAMGRWDSITAELLQYRSNGEPIWVELSLFPVSDETGTYTNWVLIQRDITMRKRAEVDRARALERAEQERRMESLEILAGGIAHEFNNLLVGIMGNSSLALEEAGSNSPAAPYLEQVEKAAMRAADLTRQMLSFSGQDSSSMASLDLSSSLQRLAAVLERQAFDREVRLVTNFTGKLPPISGDIGQIRELVMNLLNNAFEAVSAGGVVEIRTELRYLGPEDMEEVTPQVSLDPGNFVVLTIRDDGRGMDAEVRQRMFEPFFTTKSPGRGLGLSAVLGIVRRHGSAVRVQSEPGKGTSVDVFFSPITEKQLKPEDKSLLDPDWKGEGLVLVVDDDDFVRNVAKSILERIGFDVITAVDGQEGLEVFNQYADQLRAMVVDIKMPRMNGDVLLMNLRERGFHIPVVLSSGYADVDSGTQQILDDLSMFLAKPYRPVTLISALQRLMAKAGG
jgi:two-component system cell cycle sensor histidine kinase/response regulator CckA